MNQGQFEALVTELKKTNQLLADLVQRLGANSFLPHDPPPATTVVTHVPVNPDSGGRSHLPAMMPEPFAVATKPPRKGRT